VGAGFCLRLRGKSGAMNVLVTFAVQAEFSPWRRRRVFRRIASAPHPQYEAGIGENTVRVVLTGMGAENARRAAQLALADRPDLCVSSGLAGGLKPGYRPGEILAARRVSDIKGHHMSESPLELLAAADECGAKVVDLFLTSNRVLRESQEKKWMGQFADAVEMESDAVLAVAAERGVPAVAIRAIGDSCETDLPYEFDRVTDARGRVDLPALLAQILRRPHRLPELLRLGRQCRRAAASLAAFLDVYAGSPALRANLSELESPVAAT